MIGTFVTVLHVFVCVFLVILVLLQQGKGADTSATFGGGSQTFFGASGADTLLTKVTTFCAVLFMCTSVILTVRANKLAVTEGSVFQNLAEPEPTAPVPSTPPANETGGSESAAPGPGASATKDEAAAPVVAGSDGVAPSGAQSAGSDTPIAATPPAQ